MNLLLKRKTVKSVNTAIIENYVRDKKYKGMKKEIV